ncbi:hypothetical protein ES332_D02G161700v1 [Gossypium tomentosum]|uniref:Uncharacterized protein n=1 Tax=Gossypium tomentosum TaxID=34277 RepID=A0A5D2LXU6_GOSTO|nr:hypothetical protein ES332_D02G161700v1 [Gossypium tomentosum]
MMKANAGGFSAKFPLDLKRRGSSPNQIGSPGQCTKRKGRAPFPISHPPSPAQPFRSPFAPSATRETGIQPSHDEENRIKKSKKTVQCTKARGVEAMVHVQGQSLIAARGLAASC